MPSPLAARLRPRHLDEFVGQDHILAPGRLLRRAIQADQLSSLIFSGPPGTGKTTLAQIIANTTQARFTALNAVLAGIKDIRAAIAAAQTHQQQQQQRTILFIDEVHRFNKSQQDALLPWVENGTVILIGATTENPFFEVNKALVSRSRLFQLQPLTAADLRQVASQALRDPERGYGCQAIDLAPAALDHWVNVANGDARSLLNALELAVETTPPDSDGTIRIDVAIAEDSIQQRAVLYDKEGDAHFDTISAFIKSIRGSDPDAALYWLARMLYAGEDPRFIFRRLLIQASEDIGLADPQAVVVINACATAFDRVGLPEGRYPLAQATLYLATAPKSNSVMGFFDALAAVEREQQTDVPNPLKDPNRDQQGFGHGAGYRYPHAYREHWVAQQYLPSSLQGQVFYQPSEQGREAEIGAQVARRREAQLAAGLDDSAAGGLAGLTYAPTNRSVERWLQRALAQTGTQLAALRDRLFAAVKIERHDRCLDLRAGSGLLTWEALRRAPEGLTVARVETEAEAIALQAQAQALPALAQPWIVTATLAELPAALAAREPELRFEQIFGRNVLRSPDARTAAGAVLATLLAPTGQIAIAETLPRRSQRLYQLVPPDALPPALATRWAAAEEALYAQADDPLLAWDVPDLVAALAAGGLAVEAEVMALTRQVTIAPGQLQRWFARDRHPPSYGQRLSQRLAAPEIASVRAALERWQGRTVSWHNPVVLLRARHADRPETPNL